MVEAHKRGKITNAEILVDWYGFQTTSLGKMKFNREATDLKSYLSCSTAVSRSMSRLRRRKLIKRKYPGSTKNILSDFGATLFE